MSAWPLFSCGAFFGRTTLSNHKVEPTQAFEYAIYMPLLASLALRAACRLSSLKPMTAPISAEGAAVAAVH